jgi:5-methylcytosine-specific restriction endonuclease McrA
VGVVSDLVCPICGEDEMLNGQRVDDLIEITCERCDTSWKRDPSPRCPTCGGDDLEPVVKAVVEKSRGSQLSIVATQVIDLCRVCDDDVLSGYRISRSPLMPDQLPTT